MSKICRLNSASSHQLEAEQVIPDLPSVMKELIENSLDSDPHSIGIIIIKNLLNIYSSEKLLPFLITDWILSLLKITEVEFPLKT